MQENIPFRLKLKIENLLEYEETIEWSQQPILKRVLRRVYPMPIFGIVFLALGLFFIYQLLEHPHISLMVISSFVLVPIILVGVGLILAPLYILVTNNKNLYLLTNKRALILKYAVLGYQISSCRYDEMNHMDKEAGDNGTGDIYYKKTFRIGKRGKKIESFVGFIGISDLKKVQTFLIQKIKDAKNATIENYTEPSENFGLAELSYLPENIRKKIGSVVGKNEKIEWFTTPLLPRVMRHKLPRIITGIFLFIVSYFWMAQGMGLKFNTISPALIPLCITSLVAIVLAVPPIFQILTSAKNLYLITNKKICLIKKSFVGYKITTCDISEILNIRRFDGKNGNGDLLVKKTLQKLNNNNKDNFVDLWLIGIPNVRRIEKLIKLQE